MTVQDVTKELNISKSRLDEYVKLGIIEDEKKDLSKEEVDRLFLVSLLEKFDFTISEINDYLHYEELQAYKEQENLLNLKRNSLLNIIHFNEKCLLKLDYLICEARKKQQSKRKDLKK